MLRLTTFFSSSLVSSYYYMYLLLSTIIIFYYYHCLIYYSSFFKKHDAGRHNNTFARVGLNQDCVFSWLLLASSPVTLQPLIATTLAPSHDGPTTVPLTPRISGGGAAVTATYGDSIDKVCGYTCFQYDGPPVGLY